MSGGDELAHQVKHASSQQAEAYRPAVYGHVASYDPLTHRVKLVIPSLGDGDGNYVLTGWMPLGTIAAGNGWGVQIAPMGGASIQNPTAGEKCKISIMERNYGVTVCAEMCFDQVYPPPFPNLQPGEIAIQAASGSFLRFHASGEVELSVAAGGLVVNSADGSGVALTVAQGDATVNVAQGKATITAATEVDLTAPLIKLGNGGTLQPVKLEDDSPSTVLQAQ